MLVRLFAVMLLAVAALSPWNPASAQEFDRVAAVVNDEAITLRDLDARVRMALAMSRIPDSPDNRRRVVPQVLRKMIDERLQLQEAERLKITLTAAEVDGGLAAIERQNRMPPGSLVASITRAGIPAAVLRDQVRADLTWLRLTGRVLRSQIRIGDDEVNDRLQTLKERQGRPEYLVAEIFLPVDTPEQEDDARRLGERLIEQLGQGTPFPTLASQFSRSPTAANGGNMGWVAEGMVDEELFAIIQKLSKGQISPLVRTAGGYHLVAMINERVAGEQVTPEAAMVTYAEMTLPVSPKAPPKEQLMRHAAELVRPATSCADFEAIGRRAGASGIAKGGPVRLGEMNQQLRRALGGLGPNQVAAPLDTESGIRMLMVCTREEATQVTLPTAAQVRESIEDERMDMLARRYIRDLRRAAFVDIRI